MYSNFVSDLGKNSGSAMSFLGVSRSESADGSRNVKALVMEAYEEHANRVLQKICDEVKRKLRPQQDRDNPCSRQFQARRTRRNGHALFSSKSGVI